MKTHSLIVIPLFFLYFSAFSQFEEIDNNAQEYVDTDTKIAFSIPALLDPEGLILQMVVEYPVSDKLIFKNILGYEVSREWYSGKVEGFRIGGTLKFDRHKPAYKAAKYKGITTLWKRSVYSSEEFLPQEESGLWKKADFSVATDIIGLYYDIESSKKPVGKFFYNIGIMFGPELIITTPKNIPDDTIAFPKKPLVLLVDNNTYDKYKWRAMFRIIVDIGMRL